MLTKNQINELTAICDEMIEKIEPEDLEIIMKEPVFSEDGFLQNEAFWEMESVEPENLEDEFWNDEFTDDVVKFCRDYIEKHKR